MSNDNAHIANSLLNSFKAFVGSHCVLNTINAIQSDVILKDTQSAFETLQVFSRMYKNAIRNSNDQFGPIASEIAFINDYLAIEQIRFSGHRFAPIELGTIDHSTSVPTYVFQSLVENALLLSLAEKERKLSINLSQEVSDTILTIDLNPRPKGEFHSKVSGKTQLAIDRLELLKEAGLIDFQLEWNSYYFMQLKLSKT